MKKYISSRFWLLIIIDKVEILGTKWILLHNLTPLFLFRILSQDFAYYKKRPDSSMKKPDSGYHQDNSTSWILQETLGLKWITSKFLREISSKDDSLMRIHERAGVYPPLEVSAIKMAQAGRRRKEDGRMSARLSSCKSNSEILILWCQAPAKPRKV